MTKTIQKLPQIIANWLEECKNTYDLDINDAVEHYMAYASDKIIHYLNYWFAKPSNIELFTTIWNNPDAFDDSSFTYNLMTAHSHIKTQMVNRSLWKSKR